MSCHSIWTSPDGSAWTVQSNPSWDGTPTEGRAVVAADFSNGSGAVQLLDASGNSGATLYSTDALTWTPVSGPGAVVIAVVPPGTSVGAGIGVLVGSSGGGGNVYSSNDGINFSGPLTSGGGLFQPVALGYFSGTWLGSQSGGVWTSPDGVTWTFHGTSSSLQLTFNFATDGSRIVAVGSPGSFGGTGPCAIYSDDGGVTWTDSDLLSPGVAFSARDVVYVPGIGWVAVGTDTSGNPASFTSANGANWSSAHPIGSGAFGVDWSSSLGLFVVVGDPFPRCVSTSSDGSSWTAHTIPNQPAMVGEGLFDVAWDAHLSLWVAVGGQCDAVGGFIIGEIRMIP